MTFFEEVKEKSVIRVKYRLSGFDGTLSGAHRPFTIETKRFGEKNETIRIYYLCVSNVAGDLLSAGAWPSTRDNGDACVSRIDWAGSCALGDGSQFEAPSAIVRSTSICQ